MKLTVILDPRARTLRVEARRALDYPAERVTRLIAATVDQALTDTTPMCPALPAQRSTPVEATSGTERQGDEVTRRRVLRALDRGAAVAEAAARFAVTPEQIDRWDDDAALDVQTDQIAEALGE